MGFDFKKIGAVVCFVLTWPHGVLAQSCQHDRLNLLGDWGQAQFSVELADDASERAQGLMFREEMARMSGMLFIYETAGPVAFWMKNTILPLDMLFIDPTGTITAIHENAIPGDTTPIPGGENVLLVLELNAGTVQMLGITVGSTIVHPRIDQKMAASACGRQ